MLEWIAKYWLQVLFSLLTAGAGIFFKKFYDLYKKDKEKERQELKDELKKVVEETHQATINLMEAKDKQQNKEMESIRQSIEKTNMNFDTMKAGILSIQEKIFKERCRQLLEKGHTIELEEYENLSHDHTVYNSLGGNHDGDRLFKLVTTKYENGLDN